LIGSLVLLQGGVYTLVISEKVDVNDSKVDINDSKADVNDSNVNNSKIELDYYILTKENSVHMLWLIPQYFVITVGEIMFSITGLEFSYSRVITILSYLEK